MPAQLLGDVSVNGIPGAPSGSLRFYQPTTLIPVVVYSNDAATSAITQPIALDANGRSATPIYVTKMVRMIVYDVNGAQLQDVERSDGERAETVSLVNTSWPLAATEDAAWTLLATSLGTTNGSFKASGSGSVARSVQAKLSERTSVKDFGAVGNGIADDTAAFVAAIAYAALLGGAIIDVPAGTYLIASTITITANGISFKGAGSLSSIVKNSNAATDAFNVNGSRLFIEDIGISHSATSSGSGITLASGASYVTLSRLRISGHNTAGVADVGGSTRITVQFCEIVGNGNAGQNCIVLSGTTAFSGVGPTSPLILGNTLTTGAGSSGAAIKLGGSVAATNALVIGNYIFTSSQGITVDRVNGCSLMSNGSASDVATPTAIGALATAVVDVGNTYLAAAVTYVDSSAQSYNVYANPRSGRWTAGYTGTTTNVATTSAYAVDNGQFNYHRVNGTVAAITITVSNPLVTPAGQGATISFFLENNSGGAVTWAFGAGYRVAAVAPATGTGIGLTVAYNAILGKWVEISRGTAV